MNDVFLFNDRPGFLYRKLRINSNDNFNQIYTENKKKSLCDMKGITTVVGSNNSLQNTIAISQKILNRYIKIN